jgi:hypothetical protein
MGTAGMMVISVGMPRDHSAPNAICGTASFSLADAHLGIQRFSQRKRLS